MPNTRIGRQTPTTTKCCRYENTKGEEAINYYDSTGRNAMEWQKYLIYDILAVDEEGLYIHTRYGYSVPRQNGKGDILVIRELYGLLNGESILHTAHRTDTSSTAAHRLADILKLFGYEEIIRLKKDEDLKKKFKFSKQFGMEKIELLDTGGFINFRTRSSTGGLGTTYCVLIFDEAQELTTDQENTLKHTISTSKNPQSIYCGTPPTAVSVGDLFPKMRDRILSGKSQDSGWSEWGVEFLSDVEDVDLWYETNPSLGILITERIVRSQIGDDELDFNIQRLGLWTLHTIKSEISGKDWDALQVNELPALTGKLFAGVKFSQHGGNAVLCVSVKTTEGKILCEAIDCRPISQGIAWITNFIAESDICECIVDGDNGKRILEQEMIDMKLKKPIIASTSDVITAFQMFEQSIESGNIVHGNQPSMRDAITHTQKRTIGSNGGFGYRCTKDGVDTALIEAMVLANYICSITKTKAKQKISY